MGPSAVLLATPASPYSGGALSFSFGQWEKGWHPPQPELSVTCNSTEPGSTFSPLPHHSHSQAQSGHDTHSGLCMWNWAIPENDFSHSVITRLSGPGDVHPDSFSRGLGIREEEAF